MQFMWRDLTSNFDAIGPYWTSKTGLKAHELSSCFLEALEWFEHYDFHTSLVICDGAATNMSFVARHVKDVVKQPFCVNPFTRRMMYFIPDPVHILKSLRNALLSSRRDGVRNFMFAGMLITWDYIEEVFDRDCARSARGHVKFVPNLTSDAIKLTNFSKMRVGLAMHVVHNERVPAEMRAHMQATSGPRREQKTHDFLVAVKTIFDVVLSSTKITSVKDVGFQQLRRGLSWFDSWEADHFEHWQDDMTARAQAKRFLPWQTWANLRMMVNGWCGAVRSFLRHHPTHYILPKRMTQSCLESIFGRIRQMGGGGRSPTMRELWRSLEFRTMPNLRRVRRSR